jgi:hypothetical protein
MPERKEIKLTYRITEKPINPNNLLEFPVDWREPSIKPIIKYDDQKNRTHVLDRIMPYPPKNEAYWDIQLSPRFVKEKAFVIRKDGKIIPKQEPKIFGPTTDVSIPEIKGTIIKKKGKQIIVLDKDEMWSYTFIRE